MKKNKLLILALSMVMLFSFALTAMATTTPGIYANGHQFSSTLSKTSAAYTTFQADFGVLADLSKIFIVNATGQYTTLKSVADTNAVTFAGSIGTLIPAMVIPVANDGTMGASVASNPTGDTPSPVLAGNEFFIGAAITTPLTYVGSAKCGYCHRDVYNEWLATYRYTATDAPTPADIGKSVDHGHASTNTYKAQKGENGSCDHANTATTGWGTTEYSCHGIGNNLAYGKLIPSDPAYSAVPVSFKYGGIDAGITCEVCHGSGSKHMETFKAKDIYNPGKQVYGTLDLFQSKTLSCLKCHGVIKGSEGSALPTKIINSSVTAADVAELGKVAAGVHASSQVGYGNSKHYTLGMVTCIDCHDAHASKAEPEVSLDLCAQCHGSVGTIMNMMGNGGALHSFEFGMFGQSNPISGQLIASAKIYPARPKANNNNGNNTSGLVESLAKGDVTVTPAVNVFDKNGKRISTNVDPTKAGAILGFIETVDSHGAKAYSVPGTLSNLKLNGTTVTSVAYGVYINAAGTGILFDRTNIKANYKGTYSATWTSNSAAISPVSVTQDFFTVY